MFLHVPYYSCWESRGILSEPEKRLFPFCNSFTFVSVTSLKAFNYFRKTSSVRPHQVDFVFSVSALAHFFGSTYTHLFRELLKISKKISLHFAVPSLFFFGMFSWKINCCCFAFKDQNMVLCICWPFGNLGIDIGIDVGIGIGIVIFFVFRSLNLCLLKFLVK